MKRKWNRIFFKETFEMRFAVASGSFIRVQKSVRVSFEPETNQYTAVFHEWAKIKSF